MTPTKIKEYLTQTVADRVFADNLSIVALSETLNRPIVVMEYGTNDQPKINVIIGNDKTDDPIFVHFDKNRQHYSALIVQQGYNCRQILQKLKNTTPANSSNAEPSSPPTSKRRKTS